MLMAKPTQWGDQWDVPLFFHGVWGNSHGHGGAAREGFLVLRLEEAAGGQNFAPQRLLG